MNIPTIVLGMLIASLYGVAFHVWRGGNLGRLLLYLLLGWIGFWGGHFLGAWFDVKFATLGQLHLGPATLGSLLLLLIGYWLSLIESART